MQHVVAIGRNNQLLDRQPHLFRQITCENITEVSRRHRKADRCLTNFSHEVKTCALGQASSAIIAEQIIGLNIDQVKLGRDQLFNMLTKNGPIPQNPFENLEVLLPAVAYKNRHARSIIRNSTITDQLGLPSGGPTKD